MRRYQLIPAYALQTLTIVSTSPLPAGQVGVAYSFDFGAIGGVPPYTWSLASGTLPTGLTLTGPVLSGTPTAAGPYTFTIKVQDQIGSTFMLAFTMTVSAAAGAYVNPIGVLIPAGGVGATDYENLPYMANRVREGTWGSTSANTTVGASGWPTADGTWILWAGGTNVPSCFNANLASVAIAGTSGEFSCASSTLPAIGWTIMVSGTATGTPIVGYTNPSFYTISAATSTSFTLTAIGGAPITTTLAGSTAGLTFTMPFMCGYIGTGTVTAADSCSIGNIVYGNGTTTYTTFALYNITDDFGFTWAGSTGGITNMYAYIPGGYTGNPNVIEQIVLGNGSPNPAIIFTPTAQHYSQFGSISTEWLNGNWWNSKLTTHSNRTSPANFQINPGSPQGMGTGHQTGTFTATPGAGATSAVISSWSLGAGTWAMGLSGDVMNNGIGWVIATIANISGQWTATFTQPLVNAATSATFSYGGDGVPMEWQIALCIASNTSMFMNTPFLEDGSNYACGSFTNDLWTLWQAARNAYPSWAAGTKLIQEIANEIWNSGNYAYRMMYVQYLTTFYGYTEPWLYMAYRMHAIANAGRAFWGSLWGTSIQNVFAWQTKTSQTVMAPFNAYISTLGGTPSADVQWLFNAPYATPALTSAMTIAQIEAATAVTAPTQAWSSGCENRSAVAFYYGQSAGEYEANVGEWTNSAYTGITNLSLAVVDPGMQAPTATYENALLNAGSTLTFWSTGGVAHAANPMTDNAIGLDFTNSYANLIDNTNVPVLAALQQFMVSGGISWNRNVVGAPGAGPYTIQGGNYCDSNGGTWPGMPSSGNLFGSPTGAAYYVGFIINCTNPGGGTYGFAINTVTAGAVTTNVQVANSQNGNTVLQTGLSVANGTTAGVNVPLVYGSNLLVLGNGTAQAHWTAGSSTTLVFT
jgi:hypothetical protein